MTLILGQVKMRVEVTVTSHFLAARYIAWTGLSSSQTLSLLLFTILRWEIIAPLYRAQTDRLLSQN
jgi:hypothetical protein